MAQEKKYSTKKRLYVWWHYHWKLLFIALASLALLCAVVISQFKKTVPDYQIGVVSSTELPLDTQDSLVKCLTPYCTDVNNDGKVLLQLCSFKADFGEAAVANDAYDQMSGIIKLYSDIQSDNGCYIYLLQDPEGFEDTTRILQYLDGSAPGSEDSPVDVSQMCYPWASCPILASLSLDSYRGRTLMDNEIGESQDILADFSIGRRILNTDAQKSNHQEDELLWQELTKDARKMLSE